MGKDRGFFLFNATIPLEESYLEKDRSDGLGGLFLHCPGTNTLSITSYSRRSALTLDSTPLPVENEGIINNAVKTYDR